MHLVIDAANVVGSRPDGWWRDRSGAARRLLDSVAAAVLTGRLAPPVTVVLEGAARAGVAAGPFGVCRVEVVHAEREGDTAIVTLVEQLSAAAPDEPEILVVTADRGLRAGVAAHGARTVGPGWLRDRL